MSTKILVADESPTIHKIVAMAFEDEGITVEGISRGEHALEYMVGFQPNIVLADIHLPGTDGYELCQQIKNSPSYENVRVILLTSDFEDIDKDELEISRADDYISKPFKTEEILKKVKSQLAAPELEKDVPTEKEDSPQETENSQVIQDEFEDIINQSKKSTEDPLEQLFAEDEDTSLDEVELKDNSPSESNIEEVPPEIFLDISSEEAFRAETRPVKVKEDDLSSAFQSVLSSPQSGSEDTL
jgi:DNA-binding response OmpR family regulator